MDERSPYAPPASNLEIVEERKGAVWKALLLGLAADYVGTIVFGTIAVVIFTTTIAENDPVKVDALFKDPLSPLAVTFYLIGSLFSVLGGYLCARIARHKELILGLVMSAISLSTGLVLDGPDDGPILDLVLYFTSVLTIMLGAWLGMKRNQRHHLLATPD